MSELGPVGGAGELTALRKLLNECKAILFCETNLRELIGNTNVEVFKLRMSEAEFALAAKAPQGVPSREQFERELYASDEQLTHKAIMRVFDAALAAPPALPVPGPVSDTTIHHGMFPPRMFAPVLQEHQDKAIRILRPYISGAEFGEVVALVAQAIADAREAAAPKPAPAATSCNASPVETEEGTGSATRHATSPSSAQDVPTPAPGAERLPQPVCPTCSGVGTVPVSERQLKELTEKVSIYLADRGVAVSGATARKVVSIVTVDMREALAAAPPGPANCTLLKIFGPKYPCSCGDRHASAERVRELIARWRENIQFCLKESDRLADAQEDKRSERMLIRGRTIERCADALERALPPSTGEKS